jgi:hypothetical protein
MFRKLLLLSILILICSAVMASAQAARKSVSGAEVTGTFSRTFTGKFKGSTSQIKILALGKGKLKIAFDLIYPYVDGAGELSANIGQVTGEAKITGDTALYSSDEYGQCKITIKFVRPGLIRVTQEGDSSDCGFGHNVTADGSYKKTSGAKPKLDQGP